MNLARVTGSLRITSHAPLALLAALACTTSGRQAADSAAVSADVTTKTIGSTTDVSPAGRARRDSIRQTIAAARPAPVIEDTLVGKVSEMGADPATWIALVPASGRAVRLGGGNIAPLRRLTGAEVWVSGYGEHGGFDVKRFEVRRVDGRDVDDGIVMIVQPDRLALRMHSGATRAIPNAPPALRALADARVWITRPVANQAPSYGVIEEPAR